MLENLLDMVRGLGQGHVVENPEIPDEHNKAVMAEATHSVAKGLQDAVANGQGDQVSSLLKEQHGGSVMENPVAQGMQSSFLGNIESKLGIDPSGGISSFIPAILAKISNGGSSGFDLQGLLGNLTGGRQDNAQARPSGGLMDTIKGLMHF